jgi:glycosyltransferase involved in cell wall biosynthesis
LDFSAIPDGDKEYAATAYAELLRHVTRKYPEQFWNPLPRDLAGWFKQNCNLNTRKPILPLRSAKPDAADIAGKESGLSGKRAAVLLYSRYPSDPRPRRAAEAMIEAGMQVDLLCLSDAKAEARKESVGGVRVFRVPLTHRRDNKWMYFWQYGRFFASSFWFLLNRGLRHRYDVVHVHNMPDFLVFAALFPKLRGAKIILDLHDPMPELMESIYGLKADNRKVHFLRRIERWSIGFADLVLTPNIAFKKLFASRSCSPNKIEIVMNSPQPEIFDSDRFPQGRDRIDDNGEFRVMHHGLIAHRHGVDLLVEAIALLRPKIPGIRLDIYGGATPFLKTVLEVAQRLGVEGIVCHHGPKSQAEIAEAILRCHLGVVPNRRSTFTETNFPTRLFEYLAMHRPVIAPSTQGIRDYFADDQMVFFEPGNVDDLATKILYVRDHPEEVRQTVRRGHEVYRQHLWREEKAHFVDLVARLCEHS